jgi:hypothetical protein
MMASINEHLEASWDTKIASAPTTPTKSLWGWSPPGGSLGDVNYQHVVLSSPRLIEHAARVHSNGAWARHPSQSTEDYLVMISSQLPNIPEDDINGYLELYSLVQFDNAEINKRQYTEWLRNLTSILQVLDQTAYKPVELMEQGATSSSKEVKRSKKKKKSKKSES